MKVLIGLWLMLLAAAGWAAPTCAPAGAFIDAAKPVPCCIGLYLDSNYRCQRAGCKLAGEQVPADNPATRPNPTCCYGLAKIDGVCRLPTLSQSQCTILGGTSSKPCCKGLSRNAAGACARNNVLECTDIKTCCYGGAVSPCNCYCPSPYFVGT